MRSHRLVSIPFALTAVVMTSGASTPAQGAKGMAAVREKLAPMRERYEARKDFRAWVNENEAVGLKTFHTGAKAENRLNTQRALRILFGAATVANTVYTLKGDPGSSLGVFAGLYMTHQAHAAVQRSLRDSTNRTIVHALTLPGATVDPARIRRWVKAGIADPLTAPAPAKAD